MHRSPVGGNRSGSTGPVALAGLISAGQMKASPLFAWVPVDMTALFAVAVAVAILAARARLGPTTGRVVVPVVLWVLFLPAIALTTFNGYATVKVLTLFTVSLILAIAPFYLLRTTEQRRAFLVGLAVIAVLFGLTALALNPATAVDYNNRLVFEGANTIGTGRVAMSGAMIMFLYAISPHLRARTRVVLAALTLLTCALGVMTGSVGPVIGAALAMLAVVATTPLLRKYRGRAVFGLLAAGGAVAWVAMANQSDGARRIIDTLTGDATTSGSARIEMWLDSLDRIQGNPFGVGWGAYQSPSHLHDYPHNIVLEVGVEAGWVPMVAVAALLIVTTVRGAMASTKITTTALFGLFIFSALNAMVSADINGTRILWVTMFALWTVPLPGHEDRPYYSQPRSRRADLMTP